MAVLKKAIEALDPAPDKKKQLTLALSLLSELCEQKVSQFTEAIESNLRTAGTVENRSVPVTEILATHTEYRAYVKDDAGKIATEVTDAIRKFIAGGSDNILDGVASIVTTGIQAIIGAGQAVQQEMSSYFIIVQSFGIIRFDIRIWCRMIEAEGITTQIESALATAAYKSSVDVTKLSLNTFLIAYQGQLSKLGIPEAEWEKYLDAAEAMYDRLRGDRPGGGPEAPLVIGGSNFVAPAVLSGTLWSPTSRVRDA